MTATTKRMSLVEFGLGVLAGLRHRRVSVITDEDLPALHAGFKAAYDVIESEYGGHDLRFRIILDEIHGTTPHVDDIMNWWLSGGWATKDSPGTHWRLGRTDHHAAQQLLDSLPGHELLWVKAADAFLATFHGWSE